MLTESPFIVASNKVGVN